jgi:putative tricarboxylic transport membrane protein
MRPLIESAVLAVVGIIGVWGATQVPAPPVGETWAGLAPFAAAVALIVLAGMMALWQPAGHLPEGDKGAVYEILALFAIALLYQQSMRWFGYLVPTAIAAPAVLILFGVRSWIGLALSVVLCPLVFHVVFFELLGVFPPFGRVFDLLFWIRG